MFIGFVALESAIKGTVVARNGSNVPTQADSTPTFRVYGPNGLMTNGTGSLTAKDTGSITGATNASPIAITSAGHGLQTGMRVTVASVGGNTAANGTFTITVSDSNTFTLNSSTGNGSYTSGGTWTVTGVYGFSITPASGDGYTSGQKYDVVVTTIVSSTSYNHTFSFQVT